MSSAKVFLPNSIQQNPQVADIDINYATTDFLWAVFAIMLLSDLIFIFLSFRVSPILSSILHSLY
jgi:bacteriorhodopsin